MIRALVLAIGLMIATSLPANSADRFHEVEALLDDNRYAEAIERLSAMPEANDNAGQVSYYLAMAQLRRGDIQEAEDNVEIAIDRDDNNARFHALKGAIHTQQVQDAGLFGKMSLAGDIREAFERAVELAPERIGYRQNLLGFYLHAPGIAGGSTARGREQAKAIAKLDKAAGNRAFLQVHFAEEKVDDAARRFERAVAAAPEDVVLYRIANAGFSALEAWEQTRHVVSAWHNNRPNDPEARYQLGRLAALSGRYLDEGESALREYLETEHAPPLPGAAWAHFRLGLVLRHAGRDLDARRHFDNARELNDGDAQLEEALGDLE